MCEKNNANVTVNKKKLLTEMARKIDPENKAVSPEEKCELRKKAMEMCLPECKKVISIMTKQYNLDADTAASFGTDVIIRMMDRLYRYNNPRYLKDVTVEYEITTYIKRVAQDVLAKNFAAKYGIRQFQYRGLRAVMKAERELSEQCNSATTISEDLIYEYLGEKISKDLIVTYLQIIRGTYSIDEQMSLGVEAEADDRKYNPELNAMRSMGLDSFSRSRFDKLLSHFSRLDFYIILGRKGLLDGMLESMSIADFVETSDFKRFFAEDTSVRQDSDPIRVVNNKIRNKVARLEDLGLDNEEDITALVLYMKERLD